MHKDTIDWLRQIYLKADGTLAKKQWQTAEKLAKNLTRKRIIELLRLYLFQPTNPEFLQTFTNEIKELDEEFKGNDNVPELRLLAGFVMVTTFQEASHEADAFALGIRAAGFPAVRVQPVEPAMIVEAEKYLLNEAHRLRPNEFANDTAEVTKVLIARKKKMDEAADAAQKTTATDAYQQAVVDTIEASHTKLAQRVEQLAEETCLLWWVLNEFSDSIQEQVAELTPQIYALAAASEAVKRTQLVPPPPCIAPLLTRMLRNCKPGKEQPMLADYLEAARPSWRATQAKSLKIADCRDLVPLSTALEKTEELGDLTAAMKVLPKLCPGVSGELPLGFSQAAQQFYNELVFLRALENVTD